MHIFWARLASFCQIGFISDALTVSKFHNEAHDPEGQVNKIYTIVKGRETFYRRHTVPITSCSEVKYVLKRVFVGSKDCTKELKLECAYFLGQTCFCQLGFISDPLTVSKFHIETHDPKGQENKSTPLHREEEAQNTDCHEASGRLIERSYQLFLPHQENGHKVMNNKARTKYRNHTNNGSNNKQ